MSDSHSCEPGSLLQFLRIGYTMCQMISSIHIAGYKLLWFVVEQILYFTNNICYQYFHLMVFVANALERKSRSKTPILSSRVYHLLTLIFSLYPDQWMQMEKLALEVMHLEQPSCY